MASKENINADIAAMSFEQALSQLDNIVEKPIDIYTRGTSLKLHCESKLKDAQAKIEKITLSDKGAPVGAEPLDAE